MNLNAFCLWRRFSQSVRLKTRLKEGYMTKAFTAKFTFEAFVTSLLLIYYLSRKDQSFIKGRDAQLNLSGLFFVEDLDVKFSLASP